MGKKIIVDTETGEILNELDIGDRIVRQKSVDYLKDSIEFNYGSFTKLYKGFFDALNDINGSECKILFKLLEYTRYETCVISYENGKKIKMVELANEMNISESTLKRGIKKLIELGIIKKGKYDDKSMYFMNPFLCFKGSRAKTAVIKMFEDTRFNQSK